MLITAIISSIAMYINIHISTTLRRTFFSENIYNAVIKISTTHIFPGISVYVVVWFSAYSVFKPRAIYNFTARLVIHPSHPRFPLNDVAGWFFTTQPPATINT